MAATLDFEVRMGPKRKSSDQDGDEPMRILVLGDFRGSAARPPLERRKAVQVDVDNFDAVFARLAPRVDLRTAASDEPSAVGFRELDDLHPDALYRGLDAFRALEALRRRLAGGTGFQEAAEELRRRVQGLPGPEGEEISTVASPSEEDAATLERLLGAAPARTGGASRNPAGALVERLIAAQAGPAAPRPEEGRREPYLAALDRLASETMNAVLHDPQFQGLEAAWRSLHALVSSVEAEGLSVHLLDVSRGELEEDLARAGGDVRRTALWDVVVDPGPGDPESFRWSFLVGEFRFGPAFGDARLLGSLGGVASQIGAPFLAAADPALVGCASAGDLGDPARWASMPAPWQALRESEEARWIGLALPRVLLRLPYGPGRDPIESFPFDENGQSGDGGVFLWGNPAFACARLLAEAYQARGWSLEPGDVLEIGDLPAFVFEADGERKMLPCAEAWLGERAGQRLLEEGLMPLLSRRDRNGVRLLRFQSLATPTQGLAGPWSST